MGVKYLESSEVRYAILGSFINKLKMKGSPFRMKKNTEIKNGEKMK